jgi:hypothetical protein
VHFFEKSCVSLVHWIAGIATLILYGGLVFWRFLEMIKSVFLFLLIVLLLFLGRLNDGLGKPFGWVGPNSAGSPSMFSAKPCSGLGAIRASLCGSL